MVGTRLVFGPSDVRQGEPEGTALLTQRDLSNLKNGDHVQVRMWCYRNGSVVECLHDATFVGWSAQGRHPIVRKDDGLLHILLSTNQLV